MKKDFMSSLREKTSSLPTSLLSTEENIKQQIQILDPLRDLIPPLSDEEFYQLQQNLLKYGVKDPLSIWETDSTVLTIDEMSRPMYVLIDGHNRFRICKQYKLDYRINLLRFATLNEVKDYMIDFQLGRRNLSAEQISYLRGLRYLQQKSSRGGNKTIDNSQVDVSVALGQEYGVSSRTIKRDGDFAAGLDKLEPQLKKDILSGKQKMARSSIELMGKANPGKESIEPKTSAAKDGLSSSSIKQINKLEKAIRQLAIGELSIDSCVELIQKTRNLVELLQAK